jgi:hypothetical protein
MSDVSANKHSPKKPSSLSHISNVRRVMELQQPKKPKDLSRKHVKRAKNDARLDLLIKEIAGNKNTCSFFIILIYFYFQFLLVFVFIHFRC